MLSVGDVEEILNIPLLGVIPESQSVLNASNKGVPVIFDEESNAGSAYQDAVDRLLGKEVSFRFLEEEKKGIFKRLFGG
jgi:septum site-determining protein MinD